VSMDKKLAEIAALWAEWKSALMDQRSAWFEQTALRAKNRRMQIEREITANPQRLHSAASSNWLFTNLMRTRQPASPQPTAHLRRSLVVIRWPRLMRSSAIFPPIASTSIASHLQLTAWRTRTTRHGPSSKSHQRSVA
jgi:hypothetical protein